MTTERTDEEPLDNEKFEDIDDDEEEEPSLESSKVQGALSILYIVLLLVAIGVGVVPFVILYTVGWTAWQAGQIGP